MVVIVHSPVQGYSGDVGGAHFHDGIATVDDTDRQTLAYLSRRGYRIEQPISAPDTDETIPAVAPDTDEAADDRPRRGRSTAK